MLLYIVPRLVFGVVAVALYPFESLRLWVLESQDSLPYYLRDRHELISRIESLEQQVAVSGGTENTLTKLKAENEQFRQLCEAVPNERVIARVVGRPPKLPYDVIMLDRGRIHDVIADAPVFIGSDQIIGYVSRVYEKTALVTLVSTAKFESMAYIIGPNIYTYAEGVGGGMMRVVVPQGIPLGVGDTVILPAIDSGVYGTIAYIETSPTQPEQYGYVPMKQNLQSVQYVSVGREPIVPHSYEEAEALVDGLQTSLFKVNLPPGVLVTPEVASSSPETSSTSPTATTATSL
ncbi:MAG: rod shape-determining protein MreC [Candidatus Parcubacteria bacterium]|jgi:cell shape-determining protein MreC